MDSLNPLNSLNRQIELINIHLVELFTMGTTLIARRPKLNLYEFNNPAIDSLTIDRIWVDDKLKRQYQELQILQQHLIETKANYEITLNTLN